MCYLHILRFITARCINARVFFAHITAFDLQETVCRVSDSSRQDLLSQHGVYHCTFTITCSNRFLRLLTAYKRFLFEYFLIYLPKKTTFIRSREIILINPSHFSLQFFKLALSLSSISLLDVTSEATIIELFIRYKHLITIES